MTVMFLCVIPATELKTGNLCHLVTNICTMSIKVMVKKISMYCLGRCSIYFLFFVLTEMLTVAIGWLLFLIFLIINNTVIILFYLWLVASFKVIWTLECSFIEPNSTSNRLLVISDNKYLENLNQEINFIRYTSHSDFTHKWFSYCISKDSSSEKFHFINLLHRQQVQALETELQLQLPKVLSLEISDQSFYTSIS